MRNVKRSILMGLGCISALASIAPPVMAQLAQHTVTTLLRSGEPGKKKNLVIIGDGFQAGADQTTFNEYVDREIIGGIFGEGPLREDMNAFNIFRVNAISQDSGVTRIGMWVTLERNTALGYRYTGIHARCWMEPNIYYTEANLNKILDPLVGKRDYVVVVLNENGFGGCAWGDRFAVTRGANWATGAHEMGHMIGNLGDEYIETANPLNFTGTEPQRVNLTIDPIHPKWRNFVNPLTPLPTTFDPTTMDHSETAGAFEGGAIEYTTGIWRPTENGRMQTNRLPFGPVNYDRMKWVLDPVHEFTYDNTYVGDFNGDGSDDVVIHNANSLALYLSGGTLGQTTLTPEWIQTMPMPVWESFAAHDQFYVADFDGDGMDDLYVVNMRDFQVPHFAMLRSTGRGFETVRRYDQHLPAWEMREHDRFYVADFDGDAKEDLYVFNSDDWAVGYLSMLRSTGDHLVKQRLYENRLPGWDRMRPGDQLHVADFDGDGRQDLYIFNGEDWRFGYLISLRSVGYRLTPVVRYDHTLPGWGSMRPGDRFYVADFDGDGDDDLYVFNGKDFKIGYLEKLVSQRGLLLAGHRWDGEVSAWGTLMPNDQFFVADINGDGSEDLYAYNGVDMPSKYIGVLLSRGSSTLQGSWQKDRIGPWRFLWGDRFLVGNFNHGQRWQDLLVYRTNDLGLLRSEGRSVALNSMYPFWIHEHEYHVYGWW